MAQDGSEETQLALTIRRVNDGLSASMTLPDIGVSGWPAQSVEQTKNTLNVVFPSDSVLEMVSSMDYFGWPVAFAGETLSVLRRYELRFGTQPFAELRRRIGNFTTNLRST